MSSHRRKAAKIDANQPEIVKELRKKSGVTVALDKDDILVGYEGQTYWIEIKTGPKAKLRESQKKLLNEWGGHYAICWNVDQVLYEIGFNKPECKACWKKHKSPECQEDHAADAGYG